MQSPGTQSGHIDTILTSRARVQVFCNLRAWTEIERVTAAGGSDHTGRLYPALIGLFPCGGDIISCWMPASGTQRDISRSLDKFDSLLIGEALAQKLNRTMKGYFSLALIIAGLTFSLGIPAPRSARAPVYVPEGAPAFLYCEFDLTPEGQIPDDLVVYWVKDTKTLLYHVRKPTPTTYYADWVDKDRFAFSEATMRLGIVEIMIYKTQLKDSGLYVCTILGVPKSHMETTELIVEPAKPRDN